MSPAERSRSPRGNHALDAYSQAMPSAPTLSLARDGAAMMACIYTDAEQARFRSSLLDAYHALGSPALYSKAPQQVAEYAEVSGTGCVVRELLGVAPGLLDIQPLFPTPVLDRLGEVLGDGLQLEMAAGVLADHSRPFLSWHHHAGGIDDEVYRRRGKSLQDLAPRAQRVSMIVYLDPMHKDTGELLVRPGFDREPQGPLDADWSDQVVFSLEPGSVVFLDQRVWHAVRPRSPTLGMRAFVGFWFASAGAPHSETKDRSLRYEDFDDPSLRRLLSHQAAR